MERSAQRELGRGVSTSYRRHVPSTSLGHGSSRVPSNGAPSLGVQSLDHVQISSLRTERLHICTSAVERLVTVNESIENPESKLQRVAVRLALSERVEL